MPPFWSKDSGLRIAILLVVLLSAAVAVRSCGDSSWTSDNIEASKRAGAEIVKSLAAYNVKHGRYPGSLSELAPDGQKAIEPPIAGDGQWHYQIGQDGHSFYLSFVSREKHPAIYEWSWDSRVWEYDSGDL